MLASFTLVPGSILNSLRRFDPTLRDSKVPEIFTLAVRVFGENVVDSVSHTIIEALPPPRAFGGLASSLSEDDLFQTRGSFLWVKERLNPQAPLQFNPSFFMAGATQPSPQ